VLNRKSLAEIRHGQQMPKKEGRWEILSEKNLEEVHEDLWKMRKNEKTTF
jgi:hypothetical protein